jgi:hypothetical protein
MNDFIEQCRREWRRLGVSDPLAEEMATELAADLSEAEAEGVSAEEFLGRSAFDPSSFAASWAAERGIAPRLQSRGATQRAPASLVAFTATAAIALVVAGALLLTGEPKLTLRTHVAGTPTPLPPGVGGQVHSTSAAAPVEWIFLVLAIVALGFAARLWATRGRSQPPTATA